MRRIDLAARLLREPGSTLDAVARRVGYADGFALSAAFKRLRGVSPSEHRAGREHRAVAERSGGAEDRAVAEHGAGLVVPGAAPA